MWAASRENGDMTQSSWHDSYQAHLIVWGQHRADTQRISWNFWKISKLLSWPCKMTMDKTFEHFVFDHQGVWDHREDTQHACWKFSKASSLLTLTVLNDHGENFWELLPWSSRGVRATWRDMQHICWNFSNFSSLLNWRCKIDHYETFEKFYLDHQGVWRRRREDMQRLIWWEEALWTHLESSCVRHDTFILVTWIVRVWDMTQSCVWYDSSMCVAWLTYLVGKGTLNAHSRYSYVERVNHIRIIHSYTYSYSYVTPIIHIRIMHSYTCESFICDTSHSYESFI